MTQVKTFRNQWREWIFSEDRKDKDSFHILTNERRYRHYSEKEPDYGHLPRFSEQLPDLRDSLQSGFLDLLLLIFLNVILFMASYLAFLRYDVR